METISNSASSPAPSSAANPSLPAPEVHAQEGSVLPSYEAAQPQAEVSVRSQAEDIARTLRLPDGASSSGSETVADRTAAPSKSILKPAKTDATSAEAPEPPSPGAQRAIDARDERRILKQNMVLRRKDQQEFFPNSTKLPKKPGKEQAI
jgi:hypothetical protein